MSTLIGIPYPKNSVGVLPLAFLNNSDHYRASAALGNAKQILATFLVKEALTKKHEIFFQPFEQLKYHEKLVATIDFKISPVFTDL